MISTLRAIFGRRHPLHRILAQRSNPFVAQLSHSFSAYLPLRLSLYNYSDAYLMMLYFNIAFFFFDAMRRSTFFELHLTN
jgi:hypothetical protein